MSTIGNQNARRGREWRDALRKAYMQYENKEQGVRRGEALYKIGLTVTDMALNGNMDAIKEIGNRADGKPAQVQEIDVSIDASLVLIELKSRVGITQARKALKAAGADNLLPLLESIDLKPEREPALIEQS